MKRDVSTSLRHCLRGLLYPVAIFYGAAYYCNATGDSFCFYPLQLFLLSTYVGSILVLISLVFGIRSRQRVVLIWIVPALLVLAGYWTFYWSYLGGICSPIFWAICL